jgi:hypothetical protein
MDNSTKSIQDLICQRCRDDYSVVQISSELHMDVDEVVNVLAHKSKQSPTAILQIFDMKRQGLSTTQTSRELGVSTRVLRAFLPSISKEVGASVLKLKAQGLSNCAISKKVCVNPQGIARYCARYELCRKAYIRDRLRQDRAEPKFIYTLNRQKLTKTNIMTDECTHVNLASVWSFTLLSFAEVPGGSLLFAYKKCLMNIDTTREYAVTARASLLSGLYQNTSVYYENYLYFVGQYSERCARYVCDQDRWELFGKLPRKPSEILPPFMSLVMMEATRSIYVIGSSYVAIAGLIWRLDVISLTIERLNLKLPRDGHQLCCFMVSSVATEIYMLMGKHLYSFTPSTNQIQLIKEVNSRINPEGPCYFRGGTLHFSLYEGSLELEIGDL